MGIETLDPSRYRIERTLRDGCLVWDQQDGQRRVLKPVASFVDPAVAGWLAAAWHAGIPRCLGQTHDDSDQPCFVFEWIEGQSLDAYRTHHPDGADPVQLLPWMIQWSRMLAYLHLKGDNPLVHLDIKPGNLIINDQGEAGLIDFTAARLLGQPEDSAPAFTKSAEKQALTPNYAAPELAAGLPQTSSDLYALGLTFLVLLTGKDPAECRSQPLRTVLASQPDSLQYLIGRCLHSDPALRCSQADELACDLIKALEQLQAADGLAVQSVDKTNPADAEGLAGTHPSAEPAGDPVPIVPQPDQAMPAVLETACAGRLPVRARLPAPLVCAWGGAACGCELAAVLAEQEIVLVIDADLLNPRADLLLGLPYSLSRDLATVRTCGLDLALQAEQQGRLSPQLLAAMAHDTRITGVRLLDGVDPLDHYEYCHLDSLHQVLKWARLIADRVIVLCNRSVFDAFTCLSLLAADKVVIPLAGNIGAFREINRLADFLSERYQLDHNRLCYVAFPYDRQTDLSRGTMNELCGGRLSACIPDSRLRRQQCCSAIPYAARMQDGQKKEYRHLIRNLEPERPGHKQGYKPGHKQEPVPEPVPEPVNRQKGA